MKQPIRIINYVFGYNLFAGKVIHCNSKLNDIDPITKKQLLYSAEFTYKRFDETEYGGENWYFPLDKIINLKLILPGENLNVIAFDKAERFAPVGCLFREAVVESVREGLDAEAKTIFLEKF